MDEVCIIGGGVAGIVSAKISLSNNLTPVVFEKSSRPGGIWVPNSDNIGIWNSLQMNLSKFTLLFSDHLWPKEASLYPTGIEFYEYLNSYLTKHDLLKYFQFNTIVNHVEKEEEGYSVTYQNSQGTFTKIFKNVIVATGLAGRPNDSIKNKEKFQGKILEAGYYREPSIFTNKNVVVIGNSFSASDIAYEALQTANSVTQIFRKKVVFSRRIVMGLPGDFLILNFKQINETNPPVTYTKERCLEFAQMLIQVVGNPGDLVEELRISDEEMRSPGYFNFPVAKDDYYDAIKEKKINLVRGDVVEYAENGVLLRDGNVVESDMVVSALGYFHNFDFLGEKLRQILNYDRNDRKFPVTLFRNCVHPDLPGFAFAGNIYAFISSWAEISSTIGIRWIKGNLNVSQEELWEGVRLEERLRVEERDAMWAYDFIGLTKDCLKILGITVENELLQSLEYTKGPLSPVFFFRDHPNHEERIREFIRQVKTIAPGFEYN